ncbi:hypothetical protein B0T19DRAFT_429336 [Cercophora scortea]|uniref:Uncharacterized protein n=1 Tax=Cercophora scortea TaxID=314031 RepID=A0AAE0MBA5_9PEZI|nr:hypothetical protein B0T19DRAFT_429336 [Cercophora scortea]
MGIQILRIPCFGTSSSTSVPVPPTSPRRAVAQGCTHCTGCLGSSLDGAPRLVHDAPVWGLGYPCKNSKEEWLSGWIDGDGCDAMLVSRVPARLPVMEGCPDRDWKDCLDNPAVALACIHTAHLVRRHVVGWWLSNCDLVSLPTTGSFPILALVSRNPRSLFVRGAMPDVEPQGVFATGNPSTQARRAEMVVGSRSPCCQSPNT